VSLEHVAAACRVTLEHVAAACRVTLEHVAAACSAVRGLWEKKEKTTRAVTATVSDSTAGISLEEAE